MDAELHQVLTSQPLVEIQVNMETRFERPRVLLVDDDPASSELLSEVLSREGFDCETCPSGEHALKTLQQEAFDVVITDLRMAGISGLALLERARHRYPHLVFLIATADGDVHKGIEAMKQGAADYLVKPLDLDAIVGSVRYALKTKRQELEGEKHTRDLERIVNDHTKNLRLAFERIEQARAEALEVLGAALDARDDDTAQHARRVTRYTLEMARRMDCKCDELEEIARGSFLHDIGKIGIPDAILLKRGKLTSQERAVMQAHVEIGYNLLKRAAFMAPAAEIVLAHHERYDGMGYPRGLKADGIPLGARIFAVADTLDAMTSDRPYRKALPFSAAQAEIVRESGRQFDPQVVQTFLSIPEHAWASIRREASGLGSKSTQDVPKLSLIWHRWGHQEAAV